ncbi:MAG: hypothetical protein QM783_01320 [Phycisphaerales bacterium]
MTIKMFTVCAVAALAGIASAQVPYANNFNSGTPGAEWSTTQTESSPSGQRYLGQFLRDTVTLNLGDQPAGAYLLEFDFYAIRSLDGNGPAGGGPDNFSFFVDGQLVAVTNFDNYGGGGNSQAYPSFFGTGVNPAGTGAAATNTLGYTFPGALFGDATYHFSITIPHVGGVLSFGITGAPNEAADNEGWGIDNVSVIPAPGASTLALLGLGLTVRRRRR